MTFFGGYLVKFPAKQALSKLETHHLSARVSVVGGGCDRCAARRPLAGRAGTRAVAPERAAWPPRGQISARGLSRSCNNATPRHRQYLSFRQVAHFTQRTTRRNYERLSTNLQQSRASVSRPVHRHFPQNRDPAAAKSSEMAPAGTGAAALAHPPHAPPWVETIGIDRVLLTTIAALFCHNCQVPMLDAAPPGHVSSLRQSRAARAQSVECKGWVQNCAVVDGASDLGMGSGKGKAAAAFPKADSQRMQADR